MRITALFSTAMLLFILMAGAVSAADGDDQKVLVRAQRQLRQISQERDAVQAENAKLKTEVEGLTKKLGSLKKSSETALVQSRENYATLNANLQRSTQNLHQLESEKNQLQETVAGQAQLVESCESNNAKLVQASRELLANYENKSFIDALLQREPVTQLKRVEIENIAQEYEDRIERLEFKQSPQAASAIR